MGFFKFIITSCLLTPCFFTGGTIIADVGIETSITCEEMLETFAIYSANFTFCAIRNARPIKLCQNCVSTYMGVKDIYESILQIEDIGGGSCRDQLINLDRLQVVDSGFDYIEKLWARAFCDTCFDIIESEPVLKPIVSKILNASSNFKECVAKYQDTNETCKMCFKPYKTLNDDYDNMRADTGQVNFCMDIVDLMNTTRGNWSAVLGCCNDRKKPETIFLTMTSTVFIMSILFYVMAFAFNRKPEHSIVKQSRWAEKFSRRLSIASTVNT